MKQHDAARPQGAMMSDLCFQILEKVKNIDGSVSKALAQISAAANAKRQTAKLEKL
ncbi:hypothetical protein ALQ20_03333 [Pseudomonas syringae pv. atrofaciens]|uniref:hypothetical protein n=1 Tax=Pseudomonas syringae TaxID=317 RepID=UPI000F3DF5C2|nr:hypothetical protein [Pseudomonas syringae]RMP73500.1 hypothetical protein ALQ20_03333 [Pseudomonas syringae pv. atrofaciens]